MGETGIVCGRWVQLLCTGRAEPRVSRIEAHDVRRTHDVESIPRRAMSVPGCSSRSCSCPCPAGRGRQPTRRVGFGVVEPAVLSAGETRDPTRSEPGPAVRRSCHGIDGHRRAGLRAGIGSWHNAGRALPRRAFRRPREAMISNDFNRMPLAASVNFCAANHSSCGKSNPEISGELCRRPGRA